ncbi:MAG: hypothetical protein UY93_C0007G0003 [Parcubacteria group bacterium GW2011_GWA1_56_13]|nr:MAG: hypothetical protein UY93_C0007G0003 [Parcubacteria group bacterium GW2011_GWA1_56_13]
MRILLPSILIAAAIGLFVMYTNNAYQGPEGIKSLQTQVSAFDEALNKAQDLKSSRDKLISKRNTFSEENVQKLERILPDNVDNIRFVIDINGIAARRNLSLKNVALGTVSDAKSGRSALAVGSSGDPVGSAEISFALSATYDEFLSFLQDLEHSLRIVDIEKISFKSSDTGDKYEYALTVRTYWLH